ncbi:MAG TPA: Gfo/Idh/MocA family oxidoreductase, partial [Vicinamibacterales bacterium]
MKRPSRREFLKTAAVGSMAASLPATVLEAQLPDLIKPQVPPNERLQIALIGAGGQGMSDTRWALRVPGIELTAVSDIYDGRLARAKELWGQQIFTSRDYREVLARPEVDAVIIATPDHWHAQVATDAMKAGKDVYVEKPMVQKIDEGLGVGETARQTSRILQVGSQRVSSIIYAKARDLYKSGAIGELNMVEAWINRNSAMGA